MSAPDIRETLRQAMTDWDAATPQQRAEALRAAAELAARRAMIGSSEVPAIVGPAGPGMAGHARLCEPADLLNPLWNIYRLAERSERMTTAWASAADPYGHQSYSLQEIKRNALLAMRRAGVAFPEGAELPEGSF